MSKILKATSKPAFQMTQSEADALSELVNTAVKNGTMVVLGKDHCFFCGCELGKDIIDMPRVHGDGEHMLYINHCDQPRCCAAADAL